MRINHKITKIALIALHALLYLLNIFAQDTLIYHFMNPLDRQKPESKVFAHYYLNDSVFIIEGLFDSFPTDSSYRFHFKIDSACQWLMKHTADWKIFFNKNDNEKVRYLFSRGNWDIGVKWINTYKTDDSDTIYVFYEESLSNKNDFGYISTRYYFTCSSGIIAFDGLNGIWIRDDKKYLKIILNRNRPYLRKD